MYAFFKKNWNPLRKRHLYSSPDDIKKMSVANIENISPSDVPLDFFIDKEKTSRMNKEKREAMEGIMAFKIAERRDPSTIDTRRVMQSDREQAKKLKSAKQVSEFIKNQAVDMLPSLHEKQALLSGIIGLAPDKSNYFAQRELDDLEDELGNVESAAFGRGKGRKSRKGKKSSKGKTRTRRNKRTKNGGKCKKHRGTHRR
jgi:hypothetical protein